MASTNRTVIVDDYDGRELDPSDHVVVSFSYRGRDFKMDVSEDNARMCDEMIRPLIDMAREVVSSRAVRRWAKDKGIDVPNRGVISADIVDAYKEDVDAL